MNTQSAASHILGRGWEKSRLGLARTAELLRLLGSPHIGLPCVHVAGTNGKGSVCAMSASMLSAAGYRVGRFTSPWLDDIDDNVCILPSPGVTGGLAKAAETAARAAEDMADHPSEFELLTAAALLYFRDERCDIAVIEVGLGGDGDATNVIPPPLVAAVTPVSLDHTDILGATLHEIAAHKAGIIKRGSAVVCAPQPDEAMAVIDGVCRALDCPLTRVDMSAVTPLTRDLSGQSFDFGRRKGLRITLLGGHQLQNAATAVAVIDALRLQNWDVPDDAVRTGLSAARWPARFEVLRQNPLFILDGGHNPHGAAALADALRQYLPGAAPVFIMGALRDKDIESTARAAMPAGALVLCLTPKSPRAMPAVSLSVVLRAFGYSAFPADSAAQAVDMAVSAAGGGGVVCAFGSLYAASDIRRCFGL